MLKKVVVIGPESTGKSTLSAALASYFSCSWVPEFAREYLDGLDRDYIYEDLLEIGKGQLAQEDARSRPTEGLLICDTNLLVLHVWSMSKYGKVHRWIEEQIKQRKYDAYLLTDIDIPWEEDPQREHPEPEKRKHFFDWYHQLVRETGIPYRVVSGSHPERVDLSVRFIRELFDF